MNHLFSTDAIGPDFSHVVVPWLVGEQTTYEPDFEPWPTYPQRQGWHEKAFNSGDPDFLNEGRVSAADAAAMVQTWLYFCLLGLFLYPRSHELFPDFLRKLKGTSTDGRDIVDTSALQDVFAKYISDMGAVNSEEWDYHDAMTTNVLRSGVHFFERIILNEDCPLPMEIVGSIQVLLETLAWVKSRAFSREDFHAAVLYSFESKFKKTLMSQLESAGWCPSEVQRLSRILPCGALYYASKLPLRPESRSNHGSCSRESCVLLQVNEAEYKPLHASHCDQACESADADTAELINLIAKRASPLIRMDKPKTRPRLSEHIEGRPYIAISHVWADGHGNYQANSLASCQAFQIQEWVDAVSAQLPELIRSEMSAWFWIDTLCIPVASEPISKNARRSAIKGMKEVYKTATAVLVLDSELYSVKKPFSTRETALRICRMPWWRRLWTLQEGAVNINIYFQFKDSAISANSILKAIRILNDSGSIEAWVASAAMEPLRNLTAIRRLVGKGRGGDLLNMIPWRETSKSSDEWICLSTLLDLDLDWQDRFLAEFRGSEDIKEEEIPTVAFLLQQRHLPISTLFWPGNLSRLSTSMFGFSWAPKSFLG